MFSLIQIVTEPAPKVFPHTDSQITCVNQISLIRTFRKPAANVFSYTDSHKTCGKYFPLYRQSQNLWQIFSLIQTVTEPESICFPTYRQSQNLQQFDFPCKYKGWPSKNVTKNNLIFKYLSPQCSDLQNSCPYPP